MSTSISHTINNHIHPFIFHIIWHNSYVTKCQSYFFRYRSTSPNYSANYKFFKTHLSKDIIFIFLFPCLVPCFCGWWWVTVRHHSGLLFRFVFILSRLWEVPRPRGSHPSDHYAFLHLTIVYGVRIPHFVYALSPFIFSFVFFTYLTLCTFFVFCIFIDWMTLSRYLLPTNQPGQILILAK